MTKLFKITLCLYLSLSLQTTLYAETDNKNLEEAKLRSKVASILNTSNGTPFVVIGYKSYHLNESVNGGKIIKFTSDTITIKFQDKESEYHVGDTISNDEAPIQKEIIAVKQSQNYDATDHQDIFENRLSDLIDAIKSGSSKVNFLLSGIKFSQFAQDYPNSKFAKDAKYIYNSWFYG